MTSCPDDDTLAALRDAALDAAERDALMTHLDTCAECRAVVAAAARESAPDGPRPREPGAVLGRYVILETVGAGAMGVVYAAYDPELGRKVALKLLRSDPFTSGAVSDPRARLLREAQALAKLSHPNVITIHDVGTLDGEVFLAMEFVEQGTLGAWLRAERRGFREVLALLVQAGEGLRAAHEAGLVHRDFKPDNVLVGADGRARVTDFGLARVAAAAAEPREALAAPALTGAEELTRTGALVGTPAYMAPEQRAGRVADARSDQYAFAVTLFEALFGERPGEGGLPAGARASGRRARVPAWARRVVQRGLRADAAERYPSMRALLDALTRGPLLSPGRAAFALLSGALLLVAALAVRATGRQAAVCAGSDAAWGAVFAPADEDIVRRVFAATGDASAEFSFGLVKRGLEAYRAAWVAKHREACEATRVRGVQSEALLDRRMVCLEARRRQAAGLVSVLAAADRRVVQNARSALDALPTVASCDGTAPLMALDAPPAEPDQRAELARLEGELMGAAARREADQWVGCLEAARAVLPAARALGYRPLEARAKLVEGQCQVHTPPRAGATAMLHEAARLALVSRDDATVADAWIALVGAGDSTGRLGDNVGVAEYAKAAIARLGGDDDREGLRLQYLSYVLARQDKTSEAEAQGRRSVELLAKVHGPDDYRTANAEEVLSIALFDQDRMEEAYALHRRVTAARTRAFGPDNGSLQMALLNEAEDLDVMGKPAEAVARFREALSRWPAFEQGYASYGHRILATALRHAGAYGDALAEDLAALDWFAREQAWGPGTALALTGAGLDHLGLGRPREAVIFFERSLAADPTGAEGTHFGLARALWDSGGDRRRARDDAAKARDAVQARAARYGGRFKRELDAIDAWLASRPSR